jgi:acyl carrier protein
MINGHLEKLLSLPIADHPAVNVNESERERSGIICRQFCDGRSVAAIFRGAHVTDDAHLSGDLGADWLDRLELIILVEEFAGVEITDDGDQIEVVGDLIHYIDNTGGGMASRNLSTAA